MPIIMYGSSMWLNQMNKQIRELVRGVQGLWCRKSLRLARNTDNLLAMSALQLIPIDENARAVQAMKEFIDTGSVTTPGYTDICREARPLKLYPSTTIQRSFPIWFPTKEQSLEWQATNDASDSVCRLVATDGSFHVGSFDDNKVGLGMVSNDPYLGYRNCSTVWYCDIFGAELLAITAAATLIRRLLQTHAIIRTPTVFMVDSQAAIKAICNPLNTAANHARFALHRLNKLIDIAITWTKSHAGIRLNEAADEQANVAARKALFMDHLTLPTPVLPARWLVKKVMLMRAWNRCEVCWLKTWRRTYISKCTGT